MLTLANLFMVFIELVHGDYLCKSRFNETHTDPPVSTGYVLCCLSNHIQTHQ